MAGKPGRSGISTKPTQVPTRQYKDDLLAQMDGRCGVVKLLREREAVLVSDLGGADCLPYQFRSLLKRYLVLEAWIERIEEQLAKGEKIETNEWHTALTIYASLVRMIGLKRMAKSLSSLQDLLQHAPQHNGKEHDD